jgi:hypothetical protein
MDLKDIIYSYIGYTTKNYAPRIQIDNKIKWLISHPFKFKKNIYNDLIKHGKPLNINLFIKSTI